MDKNLIKKNLEKWFDSINELPDIYLIGGAVRDALLKRKPVDIDLVCKDAEKIAYKIAQGKDISVVCLEKKHKEPCYRLTDRTQTDRTIDISQLRGENIEEDLKKRDFTINAIAVKISKQNNINEILIDPLDGMTDLNNGIIRMAGEDSFSYDPLRILRAFRFSAILNFDIEQKTVGKINESLQSIVNISSERIRDEILKILSVNNSFKYIKKMDELCILEKIFPEIIPMKGCTQNSFHHLNVWDHSIAVYENCEYILNNLEMFFENYTDNIYENLESTKFRLQLLKFSALLHDTGKPSTKDKNTKTGRITFYGHDKKGAEIVSKIAKRLVFSKKETQFISSLISEHLNILTLSASNVKETTRMRMFRKMKDNIIPLLILGISDIQNSLPLGKFNDT